MRHSKSILVALAFSDYSAGIFEYAAELAKKLGASIVVGSVINQRDVDAVATISNMGFEVDGDHYIDNIRQERQNRLAEMIKAIAFPKNKVKVIVRVGNPIDELLKIVLKEEVGLVVMGIKGRTDLEQIFVGSVAEKMFRRCPVPLVSFRDEKNAERLKKRIHLG